MRWRCFGVRGVSFGVGAPIGERLSRSHSGPFTLFETLANLFTLLFAGFWPQSINPLNASTFNWASPVFVAAMLLASVYYVLRARHKYKGPVMDVVQI